MPLVLAVVERIEGRVRKPDLTGRAKEEAFDLLRMLYDQVYVDNDKYPILDDVNNDLELDKAAPLSRAAEYVYRKLDDYLASFNI